MKYLLKSTLFILTLLTLFTACEEQDISFIPSGESAFPSEDLVEASFYGRLLNQDLSPVIEANVWIGNRMAVSDSLGDWIIPRVEVTSRQAYITVEADGYFDASRVLSVLPNSMNNIRIMPVQKQSYTSIQSSAGGEVQLPDGSGVTFQLESFIDELTGAAYSGEVRVYSHSIDGRSETSQVQMPGRLESTTENMALVSFGMIAVQLETPSGELLQLKEGKPATVRYEQAQLDANAPDTIPLWYFDTGIGTWVKEGVSIKQGNAYVGEVAHFTWWNCDYPELLIDFCIQFECEIINSFLSDTLSNINRYSVLVKVKTDDDFNWRFVEPLDSTLKICNVLPINSEIEFNLLKDDGSYFMVGPFTVGAEDIDLGVHAIPCEELETDFEYRYPTPTPPPPPPPPLACMLVWSQADCEDIDQDIWIRIASTVVNSTPTIINREFLQQDSVTITIPRSQRFILSMISTETGEVLGQKSFFPEARINVGTINPATGLINATGSKLEGRLLDCSGGLSDALVRLKAQDGRIIDETRSSPVGKFELNTTNCDAQSVILSITSGGEEKVYTMNLMSDFDFGEIDMCTNGEYYFKGKINEEDFEYSRCNGRAGTSGWVAYATYEPNPNAPYFGITHTGQIVHNGTFQVGPNLPNRFNGFRWGQHSFTSTSHPFEGELRVTEYGNVAKGIFTGTCVNADGESFDLEIEMRFVRP